MRAPRRKAKGFTLVEVIAASVILCGAVMLVGRIGMQAMTGTKLNRRYEMAASLIDKQLSLLDYLGIDAFLELGESEGQSDDLGYTFLWEVQTEYQEIDSLASVQHHRRHDVRRNNSYGRRGRGDGHIRVVNG
ncbi:MAG: type IV pilus modification PilV family protein [Planctomycetota bacterium]